MVNQFSQLFDSGQCTIEAMNPDDTQSPQDDKKTSPPSGRSPHQGLKLPAPSQKSGVLKAIISIVIFALVVFGVAALLNRFVFQSYFVDGTSMTPTLQNNDRLIIDKVEKTAAEIEGKPYIPARGQIIVIDSTVSNLTEERGEQIIKRVIGLPGDHVHIENGVVTITNKAHPKGFDVNKALGLHLDPTTLDSGETFDYNVGPGEVFVLGDNRGPGGSYDSRYFFGVSSDKIIGRLWLRVMPFNHFGSF